MLRAVAGGRCGAKGQGRKQRNKPRGARMIALEVKATTRDSQHSALKKLESGTTTIETQPKQFSLKALSTSTHLAPSKLESRNQAPINAIGTDKRIRPALQKGGRCGGNPLPLEGVGPHASRPEGKAFPAKRKANRMLPKRSKSPQTLNLQPRHDKQRTKGE